MRRVGLWPRSIRWRIFLYYTALVVAGVAVLAFAHVAQSARRQSRELGLQLQSHAFEWIPMFFPPPKGFENGRPIRPDPSPLRNGPGFHRLMAASLEQQWFVLAIDADGKRVFDNGIVPEDFVVPGFVSRKEKLAILDVGGHVVAELTVPSAERVLVGVTRAGLHAGVWREAGLATAVGLAVVLAVSFAGWWLIGHGLAPLQAMSAAAARIAEGKRSDRIDVPAQHEELAHLATTLNVTFDRLDDALQKQVRFTADASHELRTPLAAIMADCQLALKKARSPERYVESLQACLEVAQYMRSLVDRLSLLAKFDAREGVLEKEALDVAELIEHVASVLRSQAEGRGITITVHTKSVTIPGDRLRLGQVLLNLGQNAVQYNRDGGSVEFRQGHTSRTVWIEVRDTGVGIAPEHLDKIFDRYYRVDRSRSASTGGTGLGLAICQSIVSAHGGRISATCTPGSGCVFRVELPDGAPA